MLVMVSPRMANQLTEFISAILMLNNSNNFETPALDKPLHKMLHKMLDKKKTEIQASFPELMWRARGDLNPRSPAPQASVFILTRLRALLNMSPLKENELKGIS